MYIRKIDMYAARYTPVVGDLGGAHCTAAGKAITAYLPTSVREHFLNSLTFLRHNENTIGTISEFEDELEKVRETGVAENIGEEISQVLGYASPIFDHHNNVIAALTLWGLISDADDASLPKIKKDLLEAANNVSKQLGSIRAAP